MKNPHHIIPQLVLNWDLAQEMIVRFISNEVKKVGYARVVVGLSGGVDSALSAVLAVKALSAENVIAFKLPYRTFNPQSLKDAEDLAHRFNLKLDNIDITNLVDAFVNERGQLGLIRKGNVMARARMIALFDAAAEHKALVLGTGNKTEILLGYTTWYGDCACSLNPIGDLYKTQVWALSAHLELPENIIAKVPSADLWTDQTDEGELGILYETADQILYHLIDRRLKIKQVVDLGFEEQAVKMVAERVKRFHFKRVVPPIAKLSPRTVGKDFLYSRDWGV